MASISKKVLAIVLVILAVGVAGAVYFLMPMLSPAPPPATATVRIGLNGPNGPIFTALYLADEEGVFAKNGVKASFVPFPGGSSDVMKAFAGNQIDFAAISMVSLPIGIQQGLTLRSVVDVEASPGWFVLVTPDSPIKTVDQLKGKQIGLSQPGSASYTWFYMLAGSKKWTVGTDITPQYLGNIQTMTAGLVSKKVDAILFQTGEAVNLVDKKQAIIIGKDTDFVPSYPNMVVATTQSLIDSNPTLVSKVVKSILVETQHIMSDSQVQNSYLMKRFNLTASSASLFSSIHPLSLDGRIDKSTMDYLRTELIASGAVKDLPAVDTWYTNQFVQ